MSRTTDFERERRRYALRKTVKRIILLVLVTAIAVAGYSLRFEIASQGISVILFDATALLIDNTGYPVSLDSNPVELIPLGKRVVTLTDSSLSIYNSAGNQVVNERTEGQNTIAVSSGRYLLTYSRGGYDVSVRSGDTLLFSKKFDNPIYTAAISPVGSFAVSTSAIGDQSQIMVYDPTFEEQFVWVSSEHIIHSLSFDPDSRLIAAGGVISQQGVMNSQINVFEIATGDRLSSTALTDELLLDMRLFEDGSLSAITDRSIYSIASAGQKINTYSMSGSPPAAYVLCADGTSVLAAGDFSSTHSLSLVRLDKNASPLSSEKVEVDIFGLYEAEDGIWALTSDR
jgi:hypothetical protein